MAHLLSRLPLLLAVLILLAVVGAAGVSRLEERDTFCLSCHLPPETTYHERTVTATEVKDPLEVVDLAAYHYWDDPTFRCVDCHRGNDRLGHRLAVMALAAGDTITWLTGQPDETVSKGDIPNVDPRTTSWAGPDRYNRRPDILNAGCTRCHAPTLTLVGFDNHFHNRLPAARTAYAATRQLHYPDDWPEGVGSERLLQNDTTILTCLDCHRAHVQGFEPEFFLDTTSVVFPACVQCHQEVGRGPLDLR